MPSVDLRDAVAGDVRPVGRGFGHVPDATARDGADDPRHQLRRAAGGRRRQPRERRRRGSRTSSSSSPPSRSNSRRIVASGTRPEQLQRALELARLELRDEADGAVEQPDEDEEGRQPVAQGGQLARRRGSPRRPRPRLALLRLEDRDDRVALADLALGDDPPEPLPVVADGEVRGAGRSAPADPPRLRDALDDAPRLGLGEGQARGAVAEARAPRGPRARSAAPGGP